MNDSISLNENPEQFLGVLELLNTYTKEELKEILQVFNVEVKELMVKLNQNVDQKNIEAASYICHQLKGVFLSLNLISLSKLCVEIENKFLSNQLDEVGVSLKELDSLVLKLLNFLEHQGWFRE